MKGSSAWVKEKSNYDYEYVDELIKEEKKIQKQLLNREKPEWDIKVFSHEISKARQREEF